ncbi:MAG TPA: phosphoglycerate dehydrogenase [Dongiaceae bacterium]|jgi:D-3-phosphoglycerate dehydrogenase|nr:phosphoglycerate dehydrogenase [Dongiaceae bacterium]
MKVLIADDLAEAALAIFRERDIDIDIRHGLKPEAIAEIIGAYDGIAVRSGAKITRDVIARADRLRVIGRAGIGVDNIDLAAATERGICVMNTPFGNSITTAEHSIAMMMALARAIPQADHSLREGKWEKNRFVGIELYGKILGIIGCGNIGAIVAERALGLKMKVLAFDPYLSPERAVALGVEKVELPTLLAHSDFISLHTPLTEATRGLIRNATLAQMKNGVRLINCARGALVVEEDLLAALQDGTVAGAALDVFAQEPPENSGLIGHPRVIATPHLGASTQEAQHNVALQIAQQICDFLIHDAVINALNMPSVSIEEAPRLKPYMLLARQLGAFAGQLAEPGVRQVIIEYEGHATELNTRPLSALALEGLLRPSLESVNMVNAPLVARERGIEVSEIKHERGGDYQTLMRVTIITDRRRSIAGTLFANGKPRIVEIKGIHIDAEVSRHMLYVTNEDKPGLIGNLGSLLGHHGINIATFALGRASVGGNAIALIAVDEAIPPPILVEVSRLPHVRRAQALIFG